MSDSPAKPSSHSVLDENERSLNHAYICSVHGSNRLGKRTARSPRATVQFDRTVSDGAFSTTVKRSWRFASLGSNIHTCLELFTKILNN